MMVSPGLADAMAAWISLPDWTVAAEADAIKPYVMIVQAIRVNAIREQKMTV